MDEHQRHDAPIERLKLIGHSERPEGSRYYPVHFIYQDEKTGGYWFKGGTGLKARWFELPDHEAKDYLSLNTFVSGPLVIG